MDQVWLLCEAAAASSNASRMWEAAAEAASAEEILEAASEEEPLEAASAEEPLEAASAEEPLQAASEEEILEAANGEKILATRAKAKWRRTSCIGHRVLVPHPPADAPPASLLGWEVPLVVGLQVPRPKKRPAPSSAASLAPHPPAEAPPEALLWAAMVGRLPPEDLTLAALDTSADTSSREA